MPTAVEYAVMANPSHAQDLVEYALSNPHTTVTEAPVLPDTTSGDWQLTGALAAPLVLMAIVVAVRRRRHNMPTGML